MVKVKEDMAGWIMSEHRVPDSRLTVIRQVEDYISPKGVHEAQWLCECSCENHKQIVVKQSALRGGRVKSCGCLRKEVAIKNGHANIKENVVELNLYDEYGLYGIGYCSNTGSKYYFDMEDYETIKGYHWFEHSSKKDNYKSLRAKVKGTQKTIKMSTLLGFKNYDHIDRNPLNNRKNNFRPATARQNSINRGIRSDNTSGVTGVSFNKNTGKWISYISIDGERVFLGLFSDKNDAIKARLSAAKEHYKEFASQEYLYEQYGITTQN